MCVAINWNLTLQSTWKIIASANGTSNLLTRKTFEVIVSATMLYKKVSIQAVAVQKDRSQANKRKEHAIATKKEKY